MIAGTLQSRSPGDVQVRALSRREWRVSDSRIAKDNALSVIGFIARNRDGYEVIEFGTPVARTVRPDLASAISCFVSETPPV